MSRLIVKNLPSKINEKKLKNEFEMYGTITDIKLMYSKSGKFRRFAFVGYQLSEDADKAKSKLDKSLLLNQQISVETCNDFGVDQKIKEHYLVFNKNHPPEVKKTKKTKPSDSDFLKSKRNNALEDDDNDGSDGDFPTNKEVKNQFVIKMRGCPFNTNEKQVKEFFFPVKPTQINMQKTEHGSRTGFVFCQFASEADRESAMQHNGDYIKGRYIELFKHFTKNRDRDTPYYEKAWMKKVAEGHKDCEIEEISESGRLYVRNLAYTATESDLEKLFETHGPLSEVSIPLDSLTKKSVGFGFVTYMIPEHALKAFNLLDGTVFQGRMIHILPAKGKVNNQTSTDNYSDYKKGKQDSLKLSSQNTHNWNTLFMGTDAVVDALAEKYNGDKSEILNSTDKHSAAVRVALGETLLVQETREFLSNNGVSLDAFSQPSAERSKSVIIAKNLPVGSTCSELREMFEKHAELGRVLLAPAGVTAIIECLQPGEAKTAFTKLAYRKFHHSPLYLEWAPIGAFTTTFKDFNKKEESPAAEDDADVSSEKEDSSAENEELEEDVTIFVKNLNFATVEDDLKKHFAKCGPLKSCLISRKKTHKSNALLSMGYGFVCFKKKADGQNALKTMQGSMLDGHKLELKLSERKTRPNIGKKRNFQVEKKQPSTKILVRNVPFQANSTEITSLFKSFGQLKSVRMPKKLGSVSTQSGSHRGFGFVDFVAKQDAKKAFEALCHSTHLYGRRLVLEWADVDEESVEGLRKKTADHFHEPSKRRKGKEEFESALNTHTDDD